MPFVFADEQLPAGLSPEDFQKLIVTELSEQLVAMVQEALRPHLYDLTGNVDYSDPPGRKK